VAASLADKVERAAEGNPLFVEEMVSMLIDGGYLGEDGGALDRLPVPPSISVLLASRLDQLPSGERRALERGAVEGTIFHSGAVEALADDDLRAGVDECLEALVRKELIRPSRASFAGVDGFRFRHVLIREAAYESVPKQIRAELHERYAGWLEQVAADRLPELEEVLGYHLEQAYRYRRDVLAADEHGTELAARAAGRLAAAGRRAQAKGDAPAAVNLLERAIALVADVPELRLAFELELGIALCDAGQLARAESVLGTVLGGARDFGNRRVELTALIGRAEVALLSDPDRAASVLDAVEAALPQLEEMNEDRALAIGWRLVGQGKGSWRGRYAFAEDACERAVEHARAAKDAREEAHIVHQLGLAAVFGPRPVDEAVARCADILSSSRGDPLIEAATLRALASREARRSSFDEARELVERAIVRYEDVGSSPLVRVSTAFARADIQLFAEDFQGAERELRPWLVGLERMGERGYRSSLMALLSVAVYGQGRLEEAEAVAREAEESASSTDIWTQSMARGTRAKVSARRGDVQSVELARGVVAAVEASDSLDLRGNALADLAEVLLALGHDEGHVRAAEAAELYGRKGNTAAAARLARAADGWSTSR
jgi:tetratricopeptide (TPR) repeat protein